MIHRGRELRGDLVFEADAVVIGLGAGGSIALRELARSGAKVIGLEEGGYNTFADFNQREEQMLPLLLQESGGRTTADLAIRVVQGRGVGGSTVHNTNLCKRTPDEILHFWRDSLHVSDATPDSLRNSFEQIERELSVSEIPARMRNRNNEALRRGTEALGWRSGPLRHNRKGCQESGFCELGCSYDAKENALKIVIPAALEAGAEVYSDVRVNRITHANGLVTGVLAVALNEAGGVVATITVNAKVVVLAGSAVGSAALAARSDLPDPHDQLGRGLRLHPGAVVAAEFEDDIIAYRGIPQSYECTEWLSFEPGGDKRAWIVPAFAHPIATASMLPGFGAAHMTAMRKYRKLAVLSAMVHDETSGRVTAYASGRPRIDYVMNDADRIALAKGLISCARILFAAGAKAVTIPTVSPLRLTRANELDTLRTDFVAPHAIPITSVHPMGSLRMGDDPKSATVQSTGEHHQLRGLFVADGSLFPTSLGVPPQISIYSFALHLSKHMIERVKS